MRDEYVTGNESYAELAKRYGVRKQTVGIHAADRNANAGRTWDELRTEFHDEVSGKAQAKASEALSRTLARVREKAATVAEKALLRLEKKLTADEVIEDRDLVQIAKLATTVKIELGGDSEGTPVNIRQTLDELTVAELRKIAAGES